MRARVVKGPDGTHRFIASTPSVDRAGDVIDPNWVLDHFIATGQPFLYAHDYQGLPVGRGVGVSVEGKNLIIDVKYVPKDIYPFAGIVEWMYDNDFLRSVSVGFKPLEWSWMEGSGGMHVTKAELLEVSAVPVPMNAEALITTRGLHPVLGGHRARADIVKGADWNAVKDFLKGSARVKISKTKAAPPPPAAAPAADAPPPAAAPAATDPAAMIDQILALIMPKDGSIAQADLDKAVEILTAMKAEMAPADDAEPDPDAAEPPPAAPPPAKGARPVVVKCGGDPMDSISKQLARIERRLVAIEAELPDDDAPVNDDLEKAFASPELMDTFSQRLG